MLVAERRDADLSRQAEVERWMAEHKPQAVFLAAAKVGGILANDTRPAEFLYDNLMIEANVIDAAYRTGVEKLLCLGSSCIYPKLAAQPIVEEALLSGPLEPTNEWYALAKIAGIKLCQAYRKQYGCNFISAMPTNLYGPGDNYDLASGHVLPALIRKAHEAKQRGAASMVVWGTGTPRREFLHVDDCADALVLLMQRYADAEHVNVGSGEDLTIAELAKVVCAVGGLCRRHRVRPVEARRHAPQADERRQVARDGLAPAHRAAPRHNGSLRVVLEAERVMSEEQRKKGPAHARALRLEAELRANLKKRKQQAKARARPAASEILPDGNPPEDSSE